MPTPQYDATLRAVASLDAATMMVLDTDHPEPRALGWSPEFTGRVVEAMQACRWFIATGFDPPGQFGTWLRRNLEENDLGPPGGRHGDFYGSWVWRAGDAVDRLCEEWQPEWSM